MRPIVWCTFYFLLISPLSNISTLNSKALKSITKKIGQKVQQLTIQNNQWPTSFQIENFLIHPQYTFHKEIQKISDDLLNRYRNDYASIAVIDNNTGKILALSGHQRSPRQKNLSLVFSGHHPAASLFKIVTAADLLENSSYHSKTPFNYRGRSTTLYKYQLKEKITKWTRFLPFEKAFAQSNNVVFGKAAIKDSDAQQILNSANDFLFNQPLLYEVAFPLSTFSPPQNQYELAEKASGFTKKTKISTLHAAILAMIPARNGTYLSPSLIDKINISHQKFEKKILEEGQVVISGESAKELRKMMELTTARGTARRLRRRLPKSFLQNFSIGSKTGSLTGGRPFGKHDWLTFYIRPKNSPSKDYGISVAILSIHQKRWYHRSSSIGNRFLREVYKKIIRPHEKSSARTLLSHVK